MQENRVSIKINAADLKKITDATKVVYDILGPHLIALKLSDRRSLPKINDGTLPFVQKALEHATTNPSFVPVYIDVPELKVDVDATELLSNLFHPIKQIASNLDDTIMLCGSEAYVAALGFYNSVKHATKMNVPGAKPIYEDLKIRFEKQGKKESKESRKVSI